MVKRLKKGFFEFWCKECDHTWSTHYGTLKFYIAFKKDKDGILKEDEIFVRIIAYKLDKAIWIFRENILDHIRTFLGFIMT